MVYRALGAEGTYAQWNIIRHINSTKLYQRIGFEKQRTHCWKEMLIKAPSMGELVPQERCEGECYIATSPP